ncbi:hypothetical protein AALB52_09345 [Lachnospiraceae bacterium 38-14]|uniref:hypothetical protein n=1 Tax=Roseburia sp. 1XD42-69 TaxID=2320088 RepID=UPI001FAAA5B5|nr:hypothetical protein [Roseburia sp. 1XD42-69]
MNMNFNFNNPTNLIFGRGSLNQLGSLPMPGKKALVLISNGKSTRENGFGNPGLAPVLAVVDLELMTTVPAKYTAYLEKGSVIYYGAWRTMKELHPFYQW